MRTINRQTDVANSVEAFKTVLVFRNQQLLDLFLNNMQGQISDGMWENCRNTQWLWREDVACVLGDKTEVLIADQWMKGKSNYPMSKTLWDCVGEDILDKNGFKNKKDAFDAWKEINEAIKSAREMTVDEKEEFIENPKAGYKNLRYRTGEKVKLFIKDIAKKLKVEGYSIEKEYLSYIIRSETTYVRIVVEIGATEYRVHLTYYIKNNAPATIKIGPNVDADTFMKIFHTVVQYTNTMHELLDLK